MDLKNNTILITGGSTGIGLALAARFLDSGNRVIICGRRLDALEDAKKKYPGLEAYQCDISKESERTTLFNNITRDFPQLNILFNNAGIQRYPTLTIAEPWADCGKEIEINFAAPIHLSMLFASHLSKQKNPAILMTTSGLAHVPFAHAPIYSATKAALHSFTLSLRYQLKDGPIKVIEISPPKVDTDLGIPGTHKEGTNVDTYADAVMAGLEKGELEITYGFSTKVANANKKEREEIFKTLNP